MDRILPRHAAIRHRWALAWVATALLAAPLAALMPRDIAGSAAMPFATPFSTMGDEQVVLALLPERTPLYLGHRLRVDVVVRTTQPVDGAAAHIDFDPRLLEVAEISVGEALPVALQNKVDREIGRISLAHGALGEPFPRADFVAATVIFTATGISASTPLTLLAAHPYLSDVTFGGVSILDAREHGDIAIAPMPTPTPTALPTSPGVPTSTPTGTPPSAATPTVTPTTTPAGIASPTPPGTPTPTPAPTATPSALLRIARLEPNQGIAGVPNEVRIFGAGLTSGSIVAVAGVTLENFTITGAQGMQASATVPTGLAAGLYAVEATGPGGATSVLPGGYTVIDAAAEDLAVTNGDLWFDPATVRQATPTLIGVNVHRSGGTQLLSDVAVHFYLDAIHPDGLLGTATLPPLAPGIDRVDVAFVAWTPAAAGSHVLYAVVDPGDVVEEGSEANNRAEWAFDVLPAAAQGDTTPPVVTQLAIAGGAQSTEALDIPLQLAAGDDASGVASMYLVERVYNNAARLWAPLQQSGWMTYTTPYTFTLAPTGGVHYLQAWVADAAGNVSTRSHRAAINYLPDQDNVRAGQVRTYRLNLQSGDLLHAHMTALAGDPDLYIWNEAGTLVGYSNAFDLAPEAVELVAMQSGVYQVEVYGYIDSRYRLALNPGAAHGAAPALQNDAKVPPVSPIVAPDAVPPGQQALPPAPREAEGSAGARLYLPAVRR